jgi:ABC-type sulfate/molybdate transport systems ATPase subunit
MRKVPNPEIAERVRRMLAVVGLAGVEERLPDQLSGGQRQRVALARALVIEPSILLLDEPLSNLDALLRKRMRLELRDIQRRLGITTVFVTHDQDEAFEMSDRIALMNGGHIEQIGSPEDIYDCPQTRFAAEFIGEASLLEGRVLSATGGEVLVEAGDLRVPALAVRPGLAAGERAVLMMRPERIELTPRSHGDAQAMTVVKRIFQGDRILFELATLQGATVHCSMRASRSIATSRPVRKSARAFANAARSRRARAAMHASDAPPKGFAAALLAPITLLYLFCLLAPISYFWPSASCATRRRNSIPRRRPLRITLDCCSTAIISVSSARLSAWPRSSPSSRSFSAMRWLTSCRAPRPPGAAFSSFS